MATHCSREPGLFDAAEFIDLPLGKVHVVAGAGATSSSNGHRVDSWEVSEFAVTRAVGGAWVLAPGAFPYIETDVLTPDMAPDADAEVDGE